MKLTMAADDVCVLMDQVAIYAEDKARITKERDDLERKVYELNGQIEQLANDLSRANQMIEFLKAKPAPMARAIYSASPANLELAENPPLDEEDFDEPQGRPL